MCCVLGYVTPMFGMHAVLFTRMTWPAAQPPPPTPATLRPPDVVSLPQQVPGNHREPPRAPRRRFSLFPRLLPVGARRVLTQRCPTVTRGAHVNAINILA